MSLTWPDNAHIGASLKAEARHTTERLGHRMTSWVIRPPGDLFMARCVDCKEAVTVAVRHFGRLPIAGAAVWFPCRRPK